MPKNIKIYITILILVLIAGGSIFYFTRNNNNSNSKTEENKSNQSKTTLISQIPFTKQTVEQKQAYCQSILEKSGFLDLVTNRDTSKALTWTSYKEGDDYLADCSAMIARTVGFPADFTFHIVKGGKKTDELKIFSPSYTKIESDKEDSKSFPPTTFNDQISYNYLKIVDDKLVYVSLSSDNLNLDKTKAVTQNILDNYLNY